MPSNQISRRMLLAAAACAPLVEAAAEPIIDIHQHTNYAGRTDDELIAHQRKMGITKTILLPAGRKYGLAAGAGGNDTCVAVARRLPKEYVYFANELPDIPETREVLEKYLKMGAIGIGEQKFHVDCDSQYIQLVASIAQEFHVPVLMHFQHNTYNLHIERFHTILEKYPRVNFIAHAQTFWANIDKNCDQVTLYPKGKVTPGGISDRLLSDYANFYGDMSAGSGLNAMLRDEDHARGFLERHQDKLLYGSDCDDRVGEGPKCSGSQQIATIRRLAPSKKIERKILYDNARKLMKIK
ncbi:MAG TPA: amidohydrolase [Bryobacteraceae bacterium]|nr:amidohydrolase [Bryobacteraceae bacterium]